MTKKLTNDPMKWVLLFLTVIFSIGVLILRVQNSSLQKQLTNELTEKEEEIKLCIADKPSINVTSKVPYSFQEFGVYSPDFEGNEIEITIYTYKRNKILRKSLTSKMENEEGWGVDVWELETYTDNLPRLETNIAIANQKDFPIFDGYENYGTPHMISDKMTDWKNQQMYISKNNNKMYLTYDYVPKSIGSVHYEFYNPNSPSGNQQFIVFWNNVKDYSMINNVTDPSVIKALEELKKLVDNVDLRTSRN